jgi:hypothetical protein
MKDFLFVCIQKDGRSLMVGVFVQKDGEDQITSTTGGTHLTDHIHSETFPLYFCKSEVFISEMSVLTSF